MRRTIVVPIAALALALSVACGGNASPMLHLNGVDISESAMRASTKASVAAGTMDCITIDRSSDAQLLARMQTTEATPQTRAANELAPGAKMRSGQQADDASILRIIAITREECR